MNKILNKTHWPHIILAYVSLFIFGYCDNIRGPLFPDILRSFGVNQTQGSLMFVLSSLSGFFASFIARKLFSIFTLRKILQFASIILFLILFLTSRSHHFYYFLTLSTLFGLFSGVLGQIPNILIHEGAELSKKQQFLSGLHAVYAIAGLLSPLGSTLVAFLFDSQWKTIYLATSFIPLTLFILTLHPSQRKHFIKENSSPSPVQINNKNFPKNKNIISELYLGLVLSSAVCAEVLISSRLALYMRNEWNFDFKNSSFYVTAFFVFLATGRVLFAKLKLASSLKAQITTCLLVSQLMLIFGLIIHPIFLCLIGLTMAPVYPFTMTLISREFSGHLEKVISYLMATDAIMLTGMHLLTGKLTDLFGIKIALYLTLIYLTFSILLLNTYSSIVGKIGKN